MARIIGALLIVQFMLLNGVYAQVDSTVPKIQAELPPVDSTVIIPPPKIKKKAAEPVSPVNIKNDTVQSKNSVDTASIVAVTKDTIPKQQALIPAYDKYVTRQMEKHPFFDVRTGIITLPVEIYSPKNKDGLFYIMCGALLFLGILRVGFPKYFNDLFSVFWRTAMRQKHIRDQLQQAGMTTLLFNMFFVVSMAIFAYLMVEYIKGGIAKPWLLFSICFVSVAFIYSFKYFILKLTGWMFGQEEALDTYTFVVFLVNKVLSIIIIPFSLILAFSERSFQQIAFIISIVVIIFLLVYRFIVGYAGIRNELKINALHLFLYFCGFEIIPVMLIYRVLVDLFARSS